MTHNTKKSIDDDVLMNKLRDIILREDRGALAQLAETINDPEKFSEKVTPIVNERIDFLKDNFPKEYTAAVEQIVDNKLKNFKDDILNHLSPSLGKMIKKYVTFQIQELKDKIDESLKSTFSVSSIKQKFKAMWSGVDESELVLTKISEVVIEEIYVIQKDSGLLKGHASRNQTIDSDVIAGMLTAIKSFVQDAFNRDGDSEDLEMIKYGTHKIFIQTFHSYYIAVAASGALSNKEQEKLATNVAEFAENELKQGSNISDEESKKISESLYQYFIETQQTKRKH